MQRAVEEEAAGGDKPSIKDATQKASRCLAKLGTSHVINIRLLLDVIDDLKFKIGS